MKIIDAGISGTNDFSSEVQWQDLHTSSKWLEVINILAPGTQPRKAQIEALQDKRILTNRRNLVVSSPTNSGKSLIGLLILLEAVACGKRALLMEPLRALAQEKMNELSQIAGTLSIALGEPIRITISTGDYRLEHEDFASPPPNTGELIIMTPERLDAILRNPDYDNWVHSIGAVCIDEAHLLRSSHRGPTLEYVITFMLSLQSPPRIALLSATLGNLDMVKTWLHPCDVIQITQRYPALEKGVIALEEEDNVDEVVIDVGSSILADKQTNLLIFVYQTQSAMRLAKVLNEALPGINAQAYHAQLSSEQRRNVKQCFEQGNCRCLVTTTALGLGVNLPASHVIVRDTTFYGQGYLDIDELLQMMGRAGRGSANGTAIVLVRKTDKWQAETLAERLRNPQLPALTSAFEMSTSSDTVPIIAERVAAYLARNHANGRTVSEIESFFNNSLGGDSQASQVKVALVWLTSPRHVMAYKDEMEKYRLTTLGMKTVLAAMPLELVCGFAQLMRDILTVNPEDTIIEQWTSLDVLVLLHLLYSRTPNLRQYSKTLVQQVDSWVEAQPQHDSVLFRRWIAGEPSTSRANEILGSIGLDTDGQKVSAHKLAYMAVYHSIILLERSHGVPVNAISRQWKIKNLEGIEERWRDDFLWLLAGTSKILDLRCFYFHLREDCNADDKRVKRVKQYLQRVQRITYELQEQLKYCSPLGSLLIDIRRTSHTSRKVGLQTIRRIEAAGITSLQQLSQLTIEQLSSLGVQHHLAAQIIQHIHRRRD